MKIKDFKKALQSDKPINSMFALIPEKQKKSFINYSQCKNLWALDVEISSCIGQDNSSHLSWVFTYPHVAMFRAALISASATLPQCAQQKRLPLRIPM